MRIPEIKLSHQGLVLVSVPLLFELIFILTLAILLSQVEQEAYRAEHSRNVLAESEKVVQLFYRAGTALATYDMTKNPLFKLSYEKTSDELLGQLLVVRWLTQEDAATRDSMMRMDSLACRLLDEMAAAESRVDRGENAFAIRRGAVDAFKAKVDDFNTNVTSINSSYKQIQAADPRTSARLRRWVEACLYSGIVLNILLAIGLARIFHRRTASRLKVLMENTHRLASHQSLTPPVGGSDEIAQLDKTFRDMADALNTAALQKQQFLAMVSHDLRSPLTSAQLSLEMISTGTKGALPQEIRGDLTAVHDSIGRLVRLINDLLDIEKMESGKFELKREVVNLSLIAENAIEAVHSLADIKSVTLAQNIEDVDVFADGERILQVLINLLGNAIKFAPDASTISLDSVVIGAFIEVRVSDQGPGIPEEFQANIFDRFQQTPGTKGGTGLGLAICKQLVEQHGGSIGVRCDRGSTFWFTLPLAQSLEKTEDHSLTDLVADTVNGANY